MNDTLESMEYTWTWRRKSRHSTSIQSTRLKLLFYVPLPGNDNRPRLIPSHSPLIIIIMLLVR